MDGRQTWFYLDDAEIAELDNNGYTWVHVPAGPHFLKQEWPLDITFGSKSRLEVNWKSGQTYYYRLDTHSFFQGYPGGIGMQWQISEVRPEFAKLEIGKYRYQPAKYSASYN